MTRRLHNYWTTRQPIAIAAGVMLLVLLLAAPTSAQAPTTEEVYRIADKLNCPLCQGVPLSDCPLVVCDQMRALIQEKLANGETEEQIVQYFVAQYGEQVLNAPPPRGFNLLVWVLPVIGLIIGAGLVTYAVRGWMRSQQRRPAAATPGEPPEQLPAEYLERLEKELEEFG